VRRRSGREPESFEAGPLAGLPAELAMARLPPGRHGLPRSFVAHNQRLRIIAGMLRALRRQGYPGTTIGHITAEARVSRAAFYQQFQSKEDCFLATHDVASQWLHERVERAADAHEEWPDRVRAGVSEALGLLAGNPALSHLFAVEALQAGPAARQRQEAFLGHFAAVLRAGRSSHAGVRADLEELLLGAAVSLIGRYADTGRAEQSRAATTALVEDLLIPYLTDAERYPDLKRRKEAGGG
jgi:AcrR family transcriptional regulator